MSPRSCRGRRSVRWLTVVALFAFVSGARIARSEETTSESRIANAKGTVTFGIAYGASLIGLDREFMVSRRVGIQAGLGLVGADLCLNTHFGDGLSSSYLSTGFWNIGISDPALGLGVVAYGFRGKKVAAQIGLGFKAYTNGLNREPPDVLLVASLGLWSAVR